MNDFPKSNIPDRLSSNDSSRFRSPNPFLLKTTYLYSPGKKRRSPYEFQDDNFFFDERPSNFQYPGTQPSSPRISNLNSPPHKEPQFPQRRTYTSYRSKSSDSDDMGYNDFFISKPQPLQFPDNPQINETPKLSSKNRSTTAFAINITSYGTPIRPVQNISYLHHDKKRLIDVESIIEPVTRSCPDKAHYNPHYTRGRRNIVKFTFDSDSNSSSGNRSDSHSFSH